MDSRVGKREKKGITLLSCEEGEEWVNSSIMKRRSKKREGYDGPHLSILTVREGRTEKDNQI